MDVIGDAIVAMRSGPPLSGRAALHGSWGIRFGGEAWMGFHVVLHGEAWLIPPGGRPSLALAAGDVVLLRNGADYGLAHEPTATHLAEFSVPYDDSRVPADWFTGDEPSAEVLCGAFALSATRPHPLIAELPPVLHLPAATDVGPRLRAVIDLLGAELGGDTRPGGSAALPALLDLLLLYTLRAWYARRADEGATGWAAALRDRGVTTALHHMQREPREPWTVASLAATAGLSRAVFARRFTTLVGVPPLAYLTWWRLTLASRALRESTDTLATIAAQVGYGSEFAFSKAFRRSFGVSPGTYRAR